MTDATTGFQFLILAEGVIAAASTIFGVSWTLKKERKENAEKAALHAKEIDARIAAVADGATAALDLFKQRCDQEFKNFARDSRDFMARREIEKADDLLRESITVTAGDLIDARLQIRDNERRISDMSGDLSQVKESIRDMRMEMGQRFDRLNDTIISHFQKV